MDDGHARRAATRFAESADDGAFLWYVTAGPCGYFVRQWRLHDEEYRVLRRWQQAAASTTSSQGPATLPPFNRRPDWECVGTDLRSALEALAQGDATLERSARLLLHELEEEITAPFTAAAGPEISSHA